MSKSMLDQARSAARQALLKKSGDRDGATKAALAVVREALPLANKTVQLIHARKAVTAVW